MDQKIAAVLAEYDSRAAAERQEMMSLTREQMGARRDDFLISVGPETGSFMNMLARDAKAKTLIELGTSYGYSTIWLAEAARANGGKLISLDVHAGKQDYAGKALERAGLREFVDFKLGDALQVLLNLDLRYDFVLIDLWKDLYVPCLDLLYPRLNRDAFIVADNMIQPVYSQKDAAIYRRHVRGKANIESILLPLGAGIELSKYTGG